MNTKLFFPLFCFCSTILFNGCKNDKAQPDFGRYPDDVGKIIVTKCAFSGCHNDASKDAAGGLSLQSWDKLFEGGNGSACVIPYHSDFSTMCYFVNTFPDLGISLLPTMPFNKEKLSKEEVVLLKNWVNAGAPDKDGFVKFSDNPSRKKFYVVNQGCDVVTVFDSQTLLPMRYINVGSSGAIESPHMIRVSPDGQFWYVIFLTSNYIEKYRTSDDSFVGRVNIGIGYWNSFCISSNSQTAYCIDYSGSNAKISIVDLQNLTATTLLGFTYPHGSSLNNSDDTLYVTEQAGNNIYKIPVADFSAYSEVPLYVTLPATSLNCHEVRFTPDGTKYFVTCQGTSEVRIFKAKTDSLLAIIPVGALPSEMSFSSSTNYMFVTCTEDTTSFPGKRGTVAIIDYITNTLVKKIYTGHQPHGIDVDDEKKLVYVINRNKTSDGPAPHHTSQCGGRNGNVSFIDLNSLTMLVQSSNNSIKKVEIAVDPYSVAIRH